MKRKAEMMAEQMHQRKIREKRKQLLPGQLKKRGVNYVSPSLKDDIDYELPASKATLKHRINPPKGNPAPGTASKRSGMTNHRRHRLAQAIASQKEHSITPDRLDLPSMTKQSFGGFVSFEMKIGDDDVVTFSLKKGDKKVQGKVDYDYGQQAYFHKGKKVATSILRTGASVTDRLSDMADDFLNFVGPPESYDELLQKLNKKKEK